jgi:CxxC-x17-CxxC domain-containing protein
MSFVDKSLKCYDCGADFIFSASEQQLFAERGHTNDPKRCTLCRASRKGQSNGQSNGFSGFNAPRRQMFPAVCAECGKQTQVPFEPRGDRPVYCSDCYSRVSLNRARV